MKPLEVLCKELGVEIGKEWEGNDGGLYKFDNQGNLLKYYITHKDWCKEQHRLPQILTGELKPVWEPKYGEKFWTVEFGEDNNIDEYIWADTYGSKRLFTKGLVFKTKEEAIEVANKMLNALKEER